MPSGSAGLCEIQEWAPAVGAVPQLSNEAIVASQLTGQMVPRWLRVAACALCPFPLPADSSPRLSVSAGSWLTTEVTAFSHCTSVWCDTRVDTSHTHLTRVLSPTPTCRSPSPLRRARSDLQCRQRCRLMHSSPARTRVRALSVPDQSCDGAARWCRLMYSIALLARTSTAGVGPFLRGY